MLCGCQQLASIVQYVERILLLLANSTSDLPLRTTKFCSVLLSSSWSSMLVVIDSLMRGSLGGKLHGGPSQLLFALHQSLRVPVREVPVGILP